MTSYAYKVHADTVGKKITVTVETSETGPYTKPFVELTGNFGPELLDKALLIAKGLNEIKAEPPKTDAKRGI